MSKRPEVAQAEFADRQYCKRLVEVAFPSSVWIGGAAYSNEELRATLSSDAGFKRQVAKKYGSDPDNSTDGDLIEKAFPATVDFEGETYQRDQLFEALFASPKLRKLLAEKYHYASDELYWERLVEIAFRKGKMHESVRIRSRRYKHEDALRKALQEGDQSFREQVGAACGFPRSVWLLELYCNRLVEVAFPTTVEIEGRLFDRDELRRALDNDRALMQRVALRHSIHREVLQSEELIDTVFPAQMEIGDRHYSKEDLLTYLPSNPKLQQRLAARIYFPPSKWLVEQEMLASGVWSGNPAAGDIYKIVAGRQLTGVCLSGGGIRSATFNLGVLQGFAQLGLLPNIDYISSVSGGGYIHEFLAGWILRNGSKSKVIEELIPQAEPGCLPRAPEPIQWLKRYSSYLTPARGMFSTDTWTAFAIWLRNTILNQIPILTAFACGFFLVHLLIPRPIDGWRPGHWHGEVLGLSGWWISGIVLSLYSIVSVWILRQESLSAGAQGRNG